MNYVFLLGSFLQVTKILNPNKVIHKYIDNFRFQLLKFKYSTVLTLAH